MEFLDIVDENDNIIGKATKEEIYEKSQTHRVVHVIIEDDEGKIALQLRGRSVPFFPLSWSTTVGGHVQSGESYEDAARRECLEELGFESGLSFFSKDFYRVPGGPVKILTTFKTNYSGPFKIDEDVVEEVDFFSIGEIKRMLESGEKFHPELLFLLQKHFF